MLGIVEYIVIPGNKRLMGKDNGGKINTSYNKNNGYENKFIFHSSVYIFPLIPTVVVSD